MTVSLLVGRARLLRDSLSASKAGETGYLFFGSIKKTTSSDPNTTSRMCPHELRPEVPTVCE